MPRKRDTPIDWEGIERDYRAGTMSVREIARWYRVDEKSIRKKAAAAGWERKGQPPHLERQPLVGQITVVTAELKPERLVDRARAITARLLDELDSVTAHIGEVEDMICAEESDPRRKQALLKAVSLGERAMTLKNLSTTMKTLAEAKAPQGKKAERQDNADRAAGHSMFGVPPAPRSAVN